MAIAADCHRAAERLEGAQRELAHVAALGKLAANRWHEASAALEDISIDEPRENGTVLEFVQPDGTVIAVPNGAIEGLTIFIGTVEIPPIAVAALFEEHGIDPETGRAEKSPQ